MAAPSATIDLARGQTARPAGVPAIRADSISKRYGHLEALRGATLDLHPGEVVALV
jgi:ABC-type sugar transport system ATPase subunit